MLTLLSATLWGCATSTPHRPSTAAALGFADHYSLTTAAAPGQPGAADGDLWWTLFDDPLMADLVPRADGLPARAAVARAYVDLRLQQARIADVQAYLAAQVQTREIARFRLEAKLVTARDGLQIDAETARIAARIPSLEAAQRADAARIAVLTGQAPGAYREVLATPAAIPTGPDGIAVGQPSDLLDRRADLRRAASRLETARWPPRLTRDARRRGRMAVRRAEEEVEDAIAAFDAARSGALALAEAFDKAGEAASLARQQYHDGLADYDVVSRAEAALLETADAWAEARAQRTCSSIDLYLALGKGASGAVTSR